MSGKYEPKYDQEMTERFYMRVTPAQKALIKEAAKLRNKDASELWRELFIGIAEGIVKENAGEMSSADLWELAGELVLTITGIRDDVKISERVRVEIVNGEE